MEFKIDNKQIEILKTVKDKTKEIYDYLSNNINTIYEKNQGNHFQDGILRMAKGIEWILSQVEKNNIKFQMDITYLIKKKIKKKIRKK